MNNTMTEEEVANLAIFQTHEHADFTTDAKQKAEAQAMKSDGEFQFKKAALEKAKVDSQYAKLLEAQNKVFQYDTEINLYNYEELLMKGAFELNQPSVEISLLSNVITIKKKAYTLFFGATNVGKSTVAAHITKSLISDIEKTGEKVLVVSLEDSAPKAYRNALCSLLHIPISTFQIPGKLMEVINSCPDKQRLFKLFNEHVIVIGNTIPGTKMPLNIVENALVFIQKMLDTQPIGYIILDYYQCINRSHDYTLDTRLSLIKFIRGFNDLLLSDDYNCAGVVFSQAIERAEDGRDPNKLGKEEKQVIVDGAEEIILIEREASLFKTTFINLKSRSIKTNNECSVGYHKLFGRYVPYDSDFEALGMEWGAGKVDISETKAERKERKNSQTRSKDVDLFFSRNIKI
jgi:energy-coupling factor transporter ATP-binding protein EcfA2